MNETKQGIQAPAKINLFLEVLGKREDGFHEIETVMQEVAWADRLLCRPVSGERLTLQCEHPEVPTDSRNLVLQAAEALRRFAGSRQGAEIVLEKRIPLGGGLGGGSSNGACALCALSRLWGVELPEQDLQALASELGSDVPFFLKGGTALCRGRGERVDSLPGVPPLDVVLVFPEWGIDTGRAYAALNPEAFGRHSADRFLEAVARRDREDIVREMFNRFEEAVFSFEPREGELFNALERLGFDALRMSGSGSTLFGVVPEGEDSRRLVRSAEEIRGVRSAVATRTVGG
jgi:4-diphosphocytidyl-2-C-methyl-D-erythritol kinase